MFHYGTLRAVPSHQERLTHLLQALNRRHLQFGTMRAPLSPVPPMVEENHPMDWNRTELKMSSRKLEDLVDVVLNPQVELPSGSQCPICMDPLTGTEDRHLLPVRLSKCKEHVFHLRCIRDWIKTKPVCPLCRAQIIEMTGYQPVVAGTYMNVTEEPTSLPGHEDVGTLVIEFHIPSGLQDKDCPLPGQPFQGLTYVTYLPNNSEGAEVLRLLRLAWNRRILFRIGFNPNTKKTDRVILNGLEMKPRRSGGITNGGYPDPSYMSRLKIDLREVGIV